MNIRYTMIAAMILSAIITYLLTPFVRSLAIKFNAIDIPDDDRRVHKTPIPRMGGLAIFFGIFISYWIFADVELFKKLAITACSVSVVVLGIVDDIKPISAKVKFAFQIWAAILIYYSGIRIDYITNFFSSGNDIITFGIFSLPITVFWVVGITNTINLIDGLDGLAAGISGIGAVTLAIVSLGGAFIGDSVLSMHMHQVAILSIVVAGACIGFLPHNFNPARIFMGDTGSLLLGYLLAIISIDGALKGTAVLAIAVPVFALALPIFDTAFAIVRRVISGKSIVEPDRGHLHHRLLQIGMNQKKAVMTLYAIAALMGLGAVFILNNKFVYAGIVVVAALLLIVFPLAKERRKRLNESLTQNVTGE